LKEVETCLLFQYYYMYVMLSRVWVSNLKKVEKWSKRLKEGWRFFTFYINCYRSIHRSLLWLLLQAFFATQYCNALSKSSFILSIIMDIAISSSKLVSYTSSPREFRIFFKKVSIRFEPLSRASTACAVNFETIASSSPLETLSRNLHIHPPFSVQESAQGKRLYLLEAFNQLLSTFCVEALQTLTQI
jgi:hypothetical protein